MKRLYDDAGRLAEIKRAAGDVASDLRYDGRSFLRHAAQRSLSQIFDDGFETGDAACWSGAVGGASGSGDCNADPVTAPVYSSDGLLHAQSKVEPDVDRYVFYFGDRPIGTLADDGASPTWLWLSTDHLGTPILATGSTGALHWSGGIEPFGSNFSGAQAADVFLRFPGQWDDESWTGSGLGGAHAYFNVHRWYQLEVARYSRADPLFFTLQDINAYAYGGSDPLINIDPLGLQSYHCTRPLGKPPGPKTPLPVVNHQYACVLEQDGSYTCDSTSKQDGAGAVFGDFELGVGGNRLDFFEVNSCEQIEPVNPCFEDCLREQWSQPRRTYAVGWRGEDCQEYTERVIDECRQRCSVLGMPGAPKVRS